MSRFVSGRDDKNTNNILETTGDTATGAIISPTPTQNNHLATLGYATTAIASIPVASNTLNCVFVGGYDGAGCDGTWTVPTGVTNIFVQIWGGGAGGAMGCNWKAGAPGGGGGYSHRSIPVTPGQVFCFCAGGGGRGGCQYPGAKRGCTGCNSRFCGPTSGGTVCMIACGASSTSCGGTTFGERSCGGFSSGGDINIPGGDGIQAGCCSCMINKCATASGCYTPSIWAGGSFLGAQNQRLPTCGLCSPGRCGAAFGGGGFGGIFSTYGGQCWCGSSGGPGAVMIWF